MGVAFVKIEEVAQQANLVLRRTSRVGQYRTHCPFCGDDTRHWHLYLNTDRDVFYCQRCGEQGGVIRFYALLHDVTEAEAKEKLYPPKPGSHQFRHPALSLTREQLDQAGIIGGLRKKPSSMSDKEWFAYRKRTLDWIWREWRAYERARREQAIRLSELVAHQAGS